MGERSLVVYQFSRDKVEQGDFTPFLAQFGLDRLPSGPALADMLGGFAFTVDGYNDDPREIYAIPEVRSFYSAFHKAWPYWLYFCDLNQDSLKTMVLCCLPSLSAVGRRGNLRVGVEVNPEELLQFIVADFPPMNAMFERAGLPQQANIDRTVEVVHFFGFPFYVPPPG